MTTQATTAASFSIAGLGTTSSSASLASTGLSFSIPTTAPGTQSQLNTTSSFGFSQTSTSGTTSLSLGPASKSSAETTLATSSAAQSSSALAVASSSGTTSTPTAAAASVPKLPSEITGRSVEEIIKEWNAELQARTGKFRKQATAIGEWDRRILQNRDALLRLETEVANVVETQTNLERQLELIETHQEEVDKALQSMEDEAERIYKDERALLLDDEAASTRDAMYEQAEFIERELEHMTEQIKSVIQAVNANQAGELEATDGMTPLDVVVRILNNQLSSLMWIDEKAEEFSSQIQKLASQGSSADRELVGQKYWMS